MDARLPVPVEVQHEADMHKYRGEEMENVYYSPESFGLELIDEIDTDDSYGFNKTVVWKDAEGGHYLGEDSGCSCPSPFEWATSLADLTRFDKHSLQVVEDSLKSVGASFSQAKDFMDTVKQSLKGG